MNGKCVIYAGIFTVLTTNFDKLYPHTFDVFIKTSLNLLLTVYLVILSQMLLLF